MKSSAFIIVILLSLLALAPSTRADWLIDRSGTLVQIDGAILGEDDTDDTPLESSRLLLEKRREELDSQRDKSRELMKKQTEIRLKTQEKTGQRSRVEIETKDGEYKLKQEVKDANGRLLQTREIEIEDGESLHVEQEDGKTVEIDVSADGRLELIKQRIRTSTDLNLQVGEKNEISVTLPNGKIREVSLPDKALENLIENGIIAQAEGQEDAYVLTAGKSGEPVYQVEGQVEKKVLGLFKLKFLHKLDIAAGDSSDGSIAAGDILRSDSQETGWRKFLERLSL